VNSQASDQGGGGPRFAPQEVRKIDLSPGIFSVVGPLPVLVAVACLLSHPTYWSLLRAASR